MEELLRYTLDQIALEGPKGCSVQGLVALLEEQLPLKLPRSSFEVLPLPLWKLLWRLLIKCSWEVEFFRAPAASSSTAPEGEQQVKLEDRNAIADYEALDKASICVVACVSLRNAALGVFDDELSSYKISSLQRDTLEQLGKRRYKGCLRTELTRIMGSDPNRFHYVIKVLESRGLVTQHPVEAKESSSKAAQVIQTAIVHLRRFAPRLAQAHGFKEVKTENGETEMVVSDHLYKQQKQICEALELAQDWTLLESDIKQLLGFRLTAGHRAWRRLRGHLQRDGYVKLLMVLQRGREGKPKQALQLVKPYRGKPAGRSRPAAGIDDDEEEDEEAFTGTEVIVFAERAFTWHAMRLLIQAGKEGIFKHNLSAVLGLAQKRAKSRLNDLRIKFNLRQANIQMKKQLAKKLIAPPEILADYASPAMMASLSLDARASQMPAQSNGTREDAKSSDDDDDDDGDGDEEEDEEEDEEGLGNRRSKQLSAGDIAAEDGEPASPMQPLSYKDLRRLSEVEITKLGVSELYKSRTNASDLGMSRLQRLIEKVQKDGYILRKQMPKFFADYEQLPTRLSMDKRTMLRIIDQAVAGNRVSHYSLLMPTVKSGRGRYPCEVVCRVDADLHNDQDLLKEVFVACLRSFRREGKVTQRARSGPDVLEVDKLTRITSSALKHLKKTDSRGVEDDEEAPGAEKGSFSQTSLWDNGFIQSRIIRCQMLHLYLCRILGFAGADSSGLRNLIIPPSHGKDSPAEENGEVEASGIGSTNIQTARSDAKREAIEKLATVEEQAGDRKGLFTLDAVWSIFPLDLFCQLLGSACTEPRIANLILEATPLRQLNAEDSKIIVDVGAKKRLQLLLDILRKMQLISVLEQPCGQGIGAAEPLTVFVLEPEAWFEEPDPQAEDGVETDGPIVKATFDLLSETGLQSYWSRLDFACLNTPEKMKACFPGSLLPEMHSQKTWGKDKKMDIKVWFALRDRIYDQMEYFGWQHVRQAAEDFGLHVEQVGRIAQQMRSKAKRKRLQEDPNNPLPRLPTENSRAGKSKWGNADQKRKRNSAHYVVLQKLWKLGLPSKGRNPVMLRPWDVSAQDSDELKRRAKQVKQLVQEANQEVIADELDDLIAETLPAKQPDAGSALPLKHFTWTIEDDRFVITNYIKWHAVAGMKYAAYRSQQRPMHGTLLTERKCMRRLHEFQNSNSTAPSMDKIRKLVLEVHSRYKQRHKTEDPEYKNKINANQRAKMKARLKRKAERLTRAAEAAGIPVEDLEEEDEEEEEEEEPVDADLRINMFPPPPEGKLFEIDDERDDVAHERICELVDDTLASAPRRTDVLRKRKRVPDALDLQARKKLQGPMPPAHHLTGNRPTMKRTVHTPIETINQQLQRTVTKSAQSKTKLLAQKEVSITPPIAAAVELIVSLMSIQQSGGEVPPDSHTALMRRFPSDIISAAFGHLRLLNYVLHGDSGNRFRLTNDFHNLVRVVDLPRSVFDEALHAAHKIDSSDTGILTAAESGSETSNGLTAEILNMVASETVQLSLPNPKAGESDLQNVVIPAHRMIEPIPWDIKADISQGVPPILHGLPIKPYKAEKSPQPLINPADVQHSKAVRQNAWERCCLEASKNESQVAALEAVYKLIKSCGANGASTEVVSEKTTQPQRSVTKALKHLQLYGLVSRVPGYSAWAFVASEFSACFFSDPDLPADKLAEQRPHLGPMALNEGQQAEDREPEGNEPDLLPRRGDFLLAPWKNHKGKTNQKLWQDLVQRVMSIVISTPGICEADLLAEMVALNPFSAKRLVEQLLEQELLVMQVTERQTPGPPSIFGKSRSPVVETRHLFAEGRNAFSRTASVQPCE